MAKKSSEELYGPYANACGHCGAMLLSGMKPRHIKWHEESGTGPKDGSVTDGADETKDESTHTYVRT